MNEQSTRMSLGGDWQMYIGEVPRGTVPVPSSYHPLGVATLKRRLPPLPAHEGRVLLTFEGIANAAEVSLAGCSLGKMVGFTRYTFDVTEHLSTDGDELVVTLRDLNTDLGNSPGWEAYGGIIRDVYLEHVAAVYLADLYCRTSIGGESATLALEIELCNTTAQPSEAEVHTVVRDADGLIVAQTTQAHAVAPGSSIIAHAIDIERPHLWSPETPYLYTLHVDLRSAHGAHGVSRRVGIRTVEVRGRRFYLNGRPLFLKGVCRHDTWLEQGYTLTRHQMRQDMRAIKELGANFVRLVHYPHHPEILDLADELGLFATEEPGFWNVHLDAQNMERPKHVALEIMRRTILRDRSHASMFAWLLGNECWSDSAFFKEGKRLCNALDPGRLVSFSHINSDGDEPVRFTDPDFDPDFNDTHPYGDIHNFYRDPMRHFRDKPLIFGEWGGYWVWHSDWLMEQAGLAFAAAAHAPEDATEQLAGIAYWEWADSRQYSRGYPACIDGVLTEGLVTEDRQRKPVWDLMRRIFQQIDAGPPDRPTAGFGRSEDAPTIPSDLWPLDLSPALHRADQQRAWQVLAPDYTEWSSLPQGMPTSGWLLAQSVAGKPLLLSPFSSSVRLDVQRQVAEIWLLGLGTLTDGYPVSGKLGNRVARLVAAGQEQRQETWLCQGRHIARQNNIYQGSRIEPVTLDAPLLFEWVVDPDMETRQVRVYAWRLPEPRFCAYLALEVIDVHSAFVLHAISVC
jgi:hypothetical protein